MSVNRYLVESEEPEKAKSCQMVFEDDDSNEVIGFVYKVYGNLLDIVLFEEHEAPKNIICEIKTDKRWQELFEEIIKTCDENLLRQWIQ